ncbi:MAG TPA: B-box zinc finger protein [Planctomycetota bacterium]|nr:B-box zinc finger protein [Planctomycetota bacterium]
MAKTCLRHKEVPAVTMCRQCHIPICTSCSIVSPQGTFCSPECQILHRDVKSRLEDTPKGMPRMETLLKLTAAVVLIWLGFYGIHVAAERVPALQKIDVVGRLQAVFGGPEKGKLH